MWIASGGTATRSSAGTGPMILVRDAERRRAMRVHSARTSPSASEMPVPASGSLPSIALVCCALLSIVHVLSSFGVGGQERVALDLAAGQVRRGHRVAAISLAAPPDGPIASELVAAGARTLTIPKRGGTDPTLTPRLAWALGRLRADVVHSHNPLPPIY